MASRKRESVVGYAGVYFIEVPRAAGYGAEKVHYIRYRKQGKLIEEKVGGQYRDNMTAAIEAQGGKIVASIAIPPTVRPLRRW